MAAANTMGLGLLLTTLALTVALGLGLAALAQPGALTARPPESARR